MREQLVHRLAELRQEFEKGRIMLEELEQKRSDLQQNMLRIDGAVRVLEEILDSDKEASSASHTDSQSQT